MEQREKKVENVEDIRDIVCNIQANISANDQRSSIQLALGDPSLSQSFQTSPVVEESLVQAIRSSKFNCYGPSIGLLPARRAIADYLSRDLPYRLSSEDVYVTQGCRSAIEVALTCLSRPGANILLPRPGFPRYEYYASFCHLETRYYDLLPEKSWEVDLEAVEALADDNTVALVIINPGNPSSNVFMYQHLQNVAKTAKKLTIPVIADEVYGHLAFGKNPFVPMGVFGSTVPVITLGSISKRWTVPGWRLGWLVTTDPTGFFLKAGIVDSIKRHLVYISEPATIIQGAIPNIIEKTPEEFFSRIIDTLKRASEICYDRIKEIPCLSCPVKPEGSFFMFVKLNLSLLEDIADDTDFCLKLAKEESVITLPGLTMGLKNWIRIFCVRHAKVQLA